MTRKPPPKAKLVGGPCDGREVEVIGMTYQMNVPRKYGRCWYMTATYRWEPGEAPGSIIGVFAGFYDAGKRLDSLGRKIRRRLHQEQVKAKPVVISGPVA